ncbi:MAG: PAAR domain-containing protein [Alphaproteobacteria bacterium]|nr:PAAR domain-containing protein [Alphaproteobacteria bacterium]MBO6862629.1 PAAR domain-containing protein [Alphaproteobacteria bacterium]
MAMPAATVTAMHVCPMVTGIVPHVGGPVSSPSMPTVLLGGLPAIGPGSVAVCVGPPDSVVMGSPTALAGGIPMARIGDTCAHGGAIVVPMPTVLLP